MSENRIKEEFKFVCYIKGIQKTDEGNRPFIFWNSQVSSEMLFERLIPLLEQFEKERLP